MKALIGRGRLLALTNKLALTGKLALTESAYQVTDCLHVRM